MTQEFTKVPTKQKGDKWLRFPASIYSKIAMPHTEMYWQMYMLLICKDNFQLMENEKVGDDVRTSKSSDIFEKCKYNLN